jgi:hypothetical protein
MDVTIQPNEAITVAGGTSTPHSMCTASHQTPPAQPLTIDLHWTNMSKARFTGCQRPANGSKHKS